LTTTDHLTLYIAKKSSVGLGYTIRLLKQYCIFKSVACLLACLFVNCFLEVGPWKPFGKWVYTVRNR